jgi:hypothetical protein
LDHAADDVRLRPSKHGRSVSWSNGVDRRRPESSGKKITPHSVLHTQKEATHPEGDKGDQNDSDNETLASMLKTTTVSTRIINGYYQNDSDNETLASMLKTTTVSTRIINGYFITVFHNFVSCLLFIAIRHKPLLFSSTVMASSFLHFL